jgi:exonuclease III
LRLITWNLNARLRHLPGQMAALAGRAPDIVALQEMVATRVDTLRPGLATMGLSHFLTSCGVAAPWEAIGPRRFGLVIAT